jgi:hypothetical protein
MYRNPEQKSGWIKALEKYLNTIIDSGILNNKEKTKPNYLVVSTS